jgi:hypothetical protein
VRLFGCAGLAGCAALELSTGTGLFCSAFSVTGAAGVTLSDLVLWDLMPSDLSLSEIAACCDVSARTGTVTAVVSSNSATEANRVVTQKGRLKIRNIGKRRLSQFC